MKKILILASGGLDSTYLVYKNLQEGNEVSTVYVEIENNKNKVKMEREVLKLQEEYFKKNFPSLYNPNVDTINIGYKSGWHNPLVFKQAPIWLLTALTTSDYKDEIQVGYVMNDDAISYIDDFKTIYKQYKLLSSYDNGHLPELTFPLTKFKKEVIYNKLPNELKHTIVFCENPYYNKKTGKFTTCDLCDACKRYKYEGLYEEIVMNNNLFEIPSYDKEPIVSEGKTFDMPSPISYTGKQLSLFPEIEKETYECEVES